MTVFFVGFAAGVAAMGCLALCAMAADAWLWRRAQEHFDRPRGRR